MEGLESADQQETVDVVFTELLGHGFQLALRQVPLCSQECTAHWGPPVDGLPRHALDVAVDEALDSVVDAERIVSYKKL